MFKYSMIQMVRKNADKLDRSLRNQLLNAYKPLRSTPCFLHKWLERFLKRTKSIDIVIEFDREQNLTQSMSPLSTIAMNKPFGCKIKNEYPSISSCSASLTPSAIEELLDSSPEIKKIHLDREVHALLDVATPTINANSVRNGQSSLTGKDVNIAVIDTGVYPHDDLQGRIIDFKDFINQQQEAYDDNGHGTHCAGDAAGNGLISNEKYVGPAPQANIIGIKVLDKMGAGSLSTVMDGVQWCIDYNHKNLKNKIHVLSMSLGTAAQTYDNENDDPMIKIVEAAWESGITVCVAAGNEGPDSGTISSPGISNRVITVGAMDDKNTLERSDDEIAGFSSRGPTIYNVEKPDVVAPGVNIVSLRSPNSYLDKIQKGNRVDNAYFVLSGTSMATPICAGVVALMLEADPTLSPEEVKQNLLEGADHWGNFDPNIYGAGYINAERSV